MPDMENKNIVIPMINLKESAEIKYTLDFKMINVTFNKIQHNKQVYNRASIPGLRKDLLIPIIFNEDLKDRCMSRKQIMVGLAT